LPPGLILCPTDVVVSGIIGSDQYYKIVTGNTKKLSEGIGAIETKLGWVLHGKCSRENVDELSESTSFSYLAQSWESEQIDRSTEDSSLAMETFKNSLERSDCGRYIVKFPWKERKFTETYEDQARFRLRSVVKRLVRTNRLLDYDKILKSYLEEDIAEEAPRNPSSNLVRYLPHHGIVKETSETTKLRVVLDASAKHPHSDVSLNESMQSCENLLPSLGAVLLRFRQGEYAFSADVRKAFLQIEVNSEDRDSLRYLWYKDIVNNYPVEPPVAFRMKRLPFGLSVSPFILCAVIQLHLQEREKEFPKTVKDIQKNIYMDDLVVSASTKETAKKMKEDSDRLFREMGMELTKWQDNFELKNNKVKLFGLVWNSEKDTLSLTVNKEGVIPTTKRELTAFICGFWDPLGILSPVLIKLKCILSELWQGKYSWDSVLPADVVREVSDHVWSLQLAHRIEIPRAVRTVESKPVLCMFSDASQRALGAAVYLYNIDERGSCVKSNLLISKCRVVKQSKLTIPRNELSAALLGARLLRFVLKEVGNVNECKAFSDSEVVLW